MSSRRRPEVRCHCGQPVNPTFTVSVDDKLIWYRCRACGHAAPPVAWDHSVTAMEAAAQVWDLDNTKIRVGVGLQPQPLPYFGIVARQERLKQHLSWR